ncbi:hypothetical protein STCU_12293 [Strigomonas culicis]|uniref:Uncharacterized protein n=1 Tax=Strigomonas culicis TaxID=28005 RepID=S9TB08_9TRYP|nr:hypothetical protein STCU_12293 [Strigomonas culicis]|eukprot:EPY15167.1 hypothetical protein STCU_12293 [Strigomonas culicis]
MVVVQHRGLRRRVLRHVEALALVVVIDVIARVALRLGDVVLVVVLVAPLLPLPAQQLVRLLVQQLRLAPQRARGEGVVGKVVRVQRRLLRRIHPRRRGERAAGAAGGREVERLAAAPPRDLLHTAAVQRREVAAVRVGVGAAVRRQPAGARGPAALRQRERLFIEAHVHLPPRLRVVRRRLCALQHREPLERGEPLVDRVLLAEGEQIAGVAARVHAVLVAVVRLHLAHVLPHHLPRRGRLRRVAILVVVVPVGDAAAGDGQAPRGGEVRAGQEVDAVLALARVADAQPRPPRRRRPPPAALGRG